MAGYDPKRPRPAAGSDEPAPVEALIDLADHKSPDDPPSQDLPSSGSTAPVETPPGSAIPAPQPVSSDVAPEDHAAGRRSSLIVAGVLAACAVILLVVALRRRRS